MSQQTLNSLAPDFINNKYDHMNTYCETSEPKLSENFF